MNNNHGQILAVMRANWPNQNPLQPFPEDTRANISQNITATSSDPLLEKSPIPETTTIGTVTEPLKTENHQTASWPYFVVLLLLITFILIWGYRKISTKK